MPLDPKKHRKRVKHFHEPGDLHLFTFSCYRRIALLTNDPWRKMLGEGIDKAFETHRWQLAAWVFMPEHVHLLAYPLPRLDKGESSEKDSIRNVLKAIKQPFAARIKRQLTESKSPLLKTLTIRQRPGVTSFRYWQEGPGHDGNIQVVERALKAIDYLHMNPVRRGLVKKAVDWRWSSARWYLQDPKLPPLPSPVVHGLPAEYLASAD